MKSNTLGSDIPAFKKATGLSKIYDKLTLNFQIKKTNEQDKLVWIRKFITLNIFEV